MDGFIFLNSSLAGTSPSDKGTVHSVCGPFTPLWSVGCVLNDHLMDIFLWPNIISVNRQPLASLPRTSYICCFICWGRALGEERAAAAWWKYRPWTRSLIVNGVLMSWGLNKSPSWLRFILWWNQCPRVAAVQMNLLPQPSPQLLSKSP